MPVRTKDDDLSLQRLTQVLAVTSTAGGLIAISINDNPNSCTEWASWVNLYEEYRCIGQRVRYVPFYERFIPSGVVAATVLAQAPVVFACDRDASLSPPATLDIAFHKSNARTGNTCRQEAFEIRAGTAQEMLFKTTAAPNAQWNWTMTATNLSASGLYGQLFVEWFVQFRNRA